MSAAQQNASAGDLPRGGAGAPIRVMLVDDHPVVRAGLAAMLAAEPGIEVAEEAGSGEEAVALARTRPCDVVLMDLRMAGMDGAAATARILALNPAARVLVLTTYETNADILRAVEAGAAGYLVSSSRSTRPGRARRLRSMVPIEPAPPVTRMTDTGQT